MPYIYDAPVPSAQGYHDRRARDAEKEQEHADIELLKLLNGGLRHHEDVPQGETFEYGYHESDSDVSDNDYGLAHARLQTPSKQLLTSMSYLSTTPHIAVSSHIGSTTPLPDPPFIADLLQLAQLGLTPNVKWDKQDDFVMKKRYPRMSFNGHQYPPVPPDPSTLARPVDDWSDEEIPLRRTMQAHPAADRYAQELVNQYSQSSMLAYESEPYMRQYQQQAVWTPPHAQAWSNLPAVDYRAPVLQPRFVHLPERPITPHDTYRYPASHVDQIYVAPAAPEPIEVSAEHVSAAFAVWYANQVINLLVVPGQFRPGVGGASDDVWGPGGREKDGWLRVGRAPPDYSKPWGRMGMTKTPVPAPRTLQRRRPDLEPRDPWNVAWAHSVKPSSTLVNFILDMIQRMTISPTALVSAVWFLAGLGLHDGDGIKGSQLRTFLREYRSYEPEAVERRVATLGLMLAGKWLDDNSFLTKSWCEVTTLPVDQLDRMERLALSDLHYSLHVPISSWVDHVNKLYTALFSKVTPDDVDLIVYPIIDDMVTEARNAELDDPKAASPSVRCERRLSNEELPAAADQAISRDWGSFSRYYAHDQHMTSQWDSRDVGVDAGMERAERSVDALVNDEYMDEEMETEDDEEDFLDYDGAKQWLPSMSDLRRSTSNSSDRSYDSVESHLRIDSQLPSQSFHVPQDILETPPRQRVYSDWTTTSSKFASSAYDWEKSDFLYPIKPDNREACDGLAYSFNNKRAPLGLRDHNYQSAEFIEPGIAVVHPTVHDAIDYLDNTRGSDGNMRYETGNSYGRERGRGAELESVSASKRWGTRVAQW